MSFSLCERQMRADNETRAKQVRADGFFPITSMLIYEVRCAHRFFQTQKQTHISQLYCLFLKLDINSTIVLGLNLGDLEMFKGCETLVTFTGLNVFDY